MAKKPVYEAWCLECSGRYVPLATGSKRTCERACTSHGNLYRHDCTVLPLPQDTAECGSQSYKDRS
jgi:hypothetical protein